MNARVFTDLSHNSFPVGRALGVIIGKVTYKPQINIFVFLSILNLFECVESVIRTSAAEKAELVG